MFIGVPAISDGVEVKGSKAIINVRKAKVIHVLSTSSKEHKATEKTRLLIDKIYEKLVGELENGTHIKNDIITVYQRARRGSLKAHFLFEKMSQRLASEHLIEIQRIQIQETEQGVFKECAWLCCILGCCIPVFVNCYMEEKHGTEFAITFTISEVTAATNVSVLPRVSW